MFASLFLFLWAAISIGCSSKSAEESSDSSAPSSKSASLFGPKEVTLPAGTVITVRLASAVGSKTSNTGDHFNATIATPVESGGKVVLPKGAECYAYTGEKEIVLPAESALTFTLTEPVTVKM